MFVSKVQSFSFKIELRDNYLEQLSYGNNKYNSSYKYQRDLYRADAFIFDFCIHP